MNIEFVFHQAQTINYFPKTKKKRKEKILLSKMIKTVCTFVLKVLRAFRILRKVQQNIVSLTITVYIITSMF